MNHRHTLPELAQRSRHLRYQTTAFTLVELLTVIFIISLLIGILIPSINSARTAAKKVTTAKTIDAIKVGLEMFKNENEKDFRQTNGYPPSFAHPPIRGSKFNPIEGQFPFTPSSGELTPLLYGAQWLPAMLMGADAQGYVRRGSVPREGNLRQEPWRWYQPDPLGNGRPLQRTSLYLDPGSIPMKRTEDLPGTPPETGSDLFPDWDGNTSTVDRMEARPVIVDAFDQPILYYVANAHGRATNMLEDDRRADNDYSGGIQQIGPPYYFHQDNEGFTGTATEEGWNFGGVSIRDGERIHPIANPGEDLTAQEIFEQQDTFAAYILDRAVAREIAQKVALGGQTALRPANAETFLLISAGPDGRYGTKDDVSNLPPKTD